VKRSVEVVIDGKPVPLKSDYEQAYLDDLATFVEERYLEVTSTRGGNSYRKGVLAALNIADELFKEKERNQKLQDGVRQRCERIQDLIKEIDPVGARKR
jgi:cell division protein ZapA